MAQYSAPAYTQNICAVTIDTGMSNYKTIKLYTDGHLYRLKYEDEMRSNIICSESLHIPSID